MSLIVLAACKGPGGDAVQPKGSAAPPAASSAAPAISGKARRAGGGPPVVTPRADVVEHACRQEPCPGPMARMTPYLDARGAPRVWRYQGDPARCSHPPDAYLDAAGNELQLVPNRPVAKGTVIPELARAQELVKGLTKGVAQPCPEK